MADHGPSLINRVVLTSKNVQNAFPLEDPNALKSLKIDNSLSVESFKKGFKINVIEEKDDVIVFDMIGIDAPLANALRRIMISEVPTMAIEHVSIYQNTSIMQDEVLAHRLGLIPIKADPRLFEFVKETKEQEMGEGNTLVFTLQVKCTKNPKATANSPPTKLYNSSEIFSNELKWIPQGSQKEKFGPAGIRPVHPDIIITKLRPGQTIEAELLAVKGVGKDHAKWSPACTASYRLLPEVVMKQEVTGKDAKTLVNKCPMGVFDIEDLGGKTRARVKSPRNCSMCRECIRDEYWEERVGLHRVRDHFVFSVESTGAYKAREIVEEAVKVLKNKAQKMASELEEMYDDTMK